MFEKLKRNIIDQMTEASVKIGYSEGTVRLYYPVDSLSRLTGLEALDAETMAAALNSTAAAELLPGGVRFGTAEDRVSVTVGPEGARYVHDTQKPNAFTVAAVEFFRAHHFCTLEDVKALFEGFSHEYKCAVMPEDSDFSYLLYFDDETIDPYCYCVSDEMGHMSYHRFTRDDMAALMEE